MYASCPSSASCRDGRGYLQAALCPLLSVLPVEALWVPQMQHRRYDRMDLVGSVYRRLVVHGYQGAPVHALFRDEVQDFTQVMRSLTSFQL